MITLQRNTKTQTSDCDARGSGALDQDFAEWDRDSAEWDRNSAEWVCCGEKLRPIVTPGGCRTGICRHCGQQFFENAQIHDVHSPWIGVDLDGTLASDTGRELWDEEGRPKIGRPLENMVARVMRWVGDGNTVKIFTARAYSRIQVSAIKAWLAGCGLPDLEVTNVKDLNMIMLWDDRCVQVVPDSGRPVNPDKERSRRRGSSAVPRSNGKRAGLGLLSSLKLLLVL